MKLLSGKVALVTGGGGGLGRAIALALAEGGAAVAVDDVSCNKEGVPAAQVVVDEIHAQGGNGLALTYDLTSAEGAEAMVKSTVESLGSVDILVCCAGNTAPGRLHEVDEERWDSLMTVHLKGHFLATKYVLPYMLSQDSGRIITVASRSAFPVLPQQRRTESADRAFALSTPYGAAKAGVLGFTASLAVELWDTGINVNSVIPSASTQLFPGTAPRKFGGVPVAQSLEPEDVAPAVAFLAGPGGQDVSGRFLYAAGGDVVIYPPQLTMAGTRMVRKEGRWEVGELNDVLPPLFDM